MGPQLLLDKSVLHSLSHAEVYSAHQYFMLVYAPVLFIEILGDLHKYSEDIDHSKKTVADYSRKIHPIDSCFTAHYRILLVSNLLGNQVVMDGRPIRIDGRAIRDSSGHEGVFFEEEPEREALRRWSKGQFYEAEQVLSGRWRGSTRSINLESWLSTKSNVPKAETLDQALKLSQSIATNPESQFENLRFILAQAAVSREWSNRVYHYWLSQHMPRLCDYAPYASYCLAVFLLFYVALANRLIGHRPTNRVDLEYLLYLPFCKVFSSGDKVHTSLAPLLLTPEQDYIEKANLKAELKKLVDFWSSKSDKERSMFHKSLGPYPPDWSDSFVNQVWTKHMEPRANYRDIELTPEAKQRIMEQLRPQMEAVRRKFKTQV